jgi:hypothetical protein
MIVLPWTAHIGRSADSPRGRFLVSRGRPPVLPDPTRPTGSLDAHRREDAERFIEEMRGDEADLASYLRIEEREFEAGGTRSLVR